jgi:sphingolipid delta-4 desaturase
MLMTI